MHALQIRRQRHIFNLATPIFPLGSPNFSLYNMWPSPARNVKNRNNNNRISTSSPSKSSSSACSSPTSQTTIYHNQIQKNSMEEVWKDINLACLQDRPSNTIRNSGDHHAFPGMILQDFLARPFQKDPSSPAAAPIIKYSSSSSVCATDHDFLNSIEPSRHATTMLSLNSSGPDFQHIENTVPIRPINHHLHCHSSVGALSFGSSLISPFDALGSSPSIFPANLCKKRPQENLENSNDRRHKRMIKNRESAARSRARKQAYTQELEQELDRLQKENDRLRRQQEKFLAAHAQLPKKNYLYRTSTAPF